MFFIIKCIFGLILTSFFLVLAFGGMLLNFERKMERKRNE